MESVQSSPPDSSTKTHHTNARRSPLTEAQLEQRLRKTKTALKRLKKQQHTRVITALGVLAFKAGLQHIDHNILAQEFAALAERLARSLNHDDS